MAIAGLKQYQSICAELMELEVKIHKSKVYDTVSKSASEFPYTKHTIRVSGESKNVQGLLEKSELVIRKQRIENFVNSIDDITTKRIFEKRFIYGMF